MVLIYNYKGIIRVGKLDFFTFISELPVLEGLEGFTGEWIK